MSNKQRGVKFLRQRPIDDYIVDFFCKELNLIIELDGYTHQIEEIKYKDDIKLNKIKRLNYHLIKIEDKKVFENIDLVKNTIDRIIKNISHLPNPPQGGDVYLI